jgi:hypothetical protein
MFQKIKSICRLPLRVGLTLAITLTSFLVQKQPVYAAPIMDFHARVLSVPSPFTKTSPINGAVNQLSSLVLSWVASSGATSYSYCVDTINDNTCNTSWVSSGTNTSVALIGLTPGTRYWQVAAINGTETTNSDGSADAWWSFTVPTKPGAFEKLIPADGDSGRPTNPTLSWGASSMVSYYQYCVNTSATNCTVWSNTTKTSVDLTGLNPGVKYYWHVRARNSTGITFSDSGSLTTGWLSFTTLATSTPTSPIVPTIPTSTITNASSTPTATRTNPPPTSSPTKTSVPPTPTATKTSLPPTATVTQMSALPSPGSFNLISPTNGAINRPANQTLSWGASSNASSYQYCINTSASCVTPASWISTGTNTSVAPASLTPGTYFWQVRAVNIGGTTYANGSSAAWWSFNVPAIPGAFNKISPANGAAGQSTNPTLNWGASSSVSYYQYCVNTSATSCSVWNNTVSTSAAVTGLNPGIKYYWHVRARNSTGITFSNSGSLTTGWFSFTTFATPTPTKTNIPPTPTRTATKTPTPTKTNAPTTPTPVTTQAQGGKTYYVAKNGNNANPGTLAQPWLTIQKAATTMLGGDTVYIRGGTYNERVNLFYRSNASGPYITFTNYPGEEVILDGTGIAIQYGEGLFHIWKTDYIRVSGLKIQHSNGAGIYVAYSNHIIVEHNSTYDTVKSGISGWGASNVIIDSNDIALACNSHTNYPMSEENISLDNVDGFEIKNNYVHQAANIPDGASGGEGINLKDGSRNGTVHNNIVHLDGRQDGKPSNRLAFGIDAWNSPTNMTNIEIYDNVAYNSAYGFIVSSEQGGTVDGVKIYNNIAYNNTKAGFTIVWWGGTKDGVKRNIQFFNNVSYHNGTGFQNTSPLNENVIVRNNIFSQNGVPIQLLTGSESQITIDHNLFYGPGGTKGTNPVIGDPKFVNPDGADFQLQSGSPAIDAGSSLNAPNSDFAGNARPRGAGYDIGAYEY